MRKLKEIARLRFEAGRTLQEIAGAVGVARSTVQLTLQRMTEAGLSWPWPEPVDEAELERSLFTKPQPVARDAVPPPDFYQARAQLGRKGVTRSLLWLEYREQHAHGLGYSQFCDLFRRWSKTQDLVLRLQHAPGDKLFVDYAGQTMPVIAPRTGEICPAQVFVATQPGMCCMEHRRECVGLTSV